MSTLSELVNPIEYAVIITLDDPITGEQIQELCCLTSEGKIQSHSHRSSSISNNPQALIQGFSFDTNHFDLERYATRNEFQQLANLLINNTFNEAMLYQVITANDKQHESIKRRSLDELITSLSIIHTELELLTEKYDEESVARIINSGLPSIHLISEMLAADIDIELARYVN